MRFSLRCIFVAVTLIGDAARRHSLNAADSIPTKVDVGIYVNKFDQINLKDGKVDVDFYIWFRWNGSGIKPHESFDLVNGEILSREGLSESDVDGRKYACLRVHAIVQKVWNITRFPLDQHDIRLEIEDNDAEQHKLAYVPDIHNSGLNDKAVAAGWLISAGEANVGINRYATNYGDISLPTGAESVYSRFNYSVHIVRPGYSLFLKLFSGLFIAASISFLSLLIRPIDLDPRFGLGVGAMFAAVASQYVLTSNLPDTQGLTLADALHILTFIFIFITLLESTISLQLWNRGSQRLAERLDHWTLITLVSIYSAACLAIVLWI